MNANEIVKKLRETCTDNEYAPPMATNKMLNQAADLIESLQAQLAKTRLERNAKEANKNHYKTQLKNMKG